LIIINSEIFKQQEVFADESDYFPLKDEALENLRCQLLPQERTTM